MKKAILTGLILSCLLFGCGAKEKESSVRDLRENAKENDVVDIIKDTDNAGEDGNEKATDDASSQNNEDVDAVIDAFLANEIQATDGNSSFYINDWLALDEYYEVGERVDLDNDGENELILLSWYGGQYYDVKDGQLKMFAEGEGTAAVIGYTEYEGAIWIYHCDGTHEGRLTYEFDKYDGADTIVDSFNLYDEYWDGENHTYTYRDQTITKDEYDSIYNQLFYNY